MSADLAKDAGVGVHLNPLVSRRVRSPSQMAARNEAQRNRRSANREKANELDRKYYWRRRDDRLANSSRGHNERMNDTRPMATLHNQPWDDADDIWLFANIAMPTRLAARRLGRTYAAVMNRKSHLRRSANDKLTARVSGKDSDV